MPASASNKQIAYISGHTSCEQDFVESFLQTIFGCLVFGYPFEQTELREALPKSNPCVVIISAKLVTSQEEIQGAWEIVREIFPTVPILWLAPDSNDTPKFLERDNLATLLSSEVFVDYWKQVVKALATITGIEPKLTLILGAKN